MGLKTTLPVLREASTTDQLTWVAVADYSVQNNCSFELEIFLLGKTTNGTLGETAYCKALHRGKRVLSGLSLIGQPVYLVTFTTGSDTAVNTCAMQVVVFPGVGAIPPYIQLQVRGVASRNIDWYGGFKIVMH